MTRADLAARIHRNQTQVSNAVSGNRRSWPILSAINQFFGEKIFTKPKRIRKTPQPTKSHA